MCSFYPGPCAAAHDARDGVLRHAKPRCELLLGDAGVRGANRSHLIGRQLLGTGGYGVDPSDRALGVANDLQVVRIDAGSLTAQMIQWQPKTVRSGGDRVMHSFVQHSVGGPMVQVAVAIPIEAPLEYPARPAGVPPVLNNIQRMIAYPVSADAPYRLPGNLADGESGSLGDWGKPAASALAEAVRVGIGERIASRSESGDRRAIATPLARTKFLAAAIRADSGGWGRLLAHLRGLSWVPSRGRSQRRPAFSLPGLYRVMRSFGAI